MNCARLNFSHGDHESHAAVAKLVREAAAEARRPMAILADMQGPKMRIGRFAKGPIELSPGDRFALTTGNVEGNQEIVSVTYAKVRSSPMTFGGRSIVISTVSSSIRRTGSFELIVAMG